MAEAKPAAAKARSPPSHPPYLQMIGEAITALKDRTGSSQYAIGKFIEAKHKTKLPPNFAKVLLIQLRKFTASGKLIKIKNSYKLPSVPKTAAAVDKTKKPKASGKVVAPKKKKVVSGLRKRKSVKSIGKSPVKKAAAVKKKMKAKK
ncbi:Linker histone H1/H5 protein [Dioscorea alata]|uniref:Linker histone H1/H5 protein n=1 Tax=Dioscorea alata TaxID=55571 RepID=A0ACB7ULP2_DIOAL|nr:Linker histone H1/H5 protein [Dioscorea alata]